MRKFMSTRLGKGTAAAAFAIALVGGFEGLRLSSYRDVVGVWTACYGETKGIGPGMHFTAEQCSSMFLPRLQEHEAGMRACLTKPDAIPIKSYVAFVSLTYNIGIGGFCGSSVRARVNAGDLQGACDAILMWNKAGGKVVQGLVNRREKERNLCLEGARDGVL